MWAENSRRAPKRGTWDDNKISLVTLVERDSTARSRAMKTVNATNIKQVLSTATIRVVPCGQVCIRPLAWPAGSASDSVPCRLRNRSGTLRAWKRFYEHWRMRAGGRCWRHWLMVRQPRVSWRHCSRLLARASPGICGCCARQDWWRSGRRRSDESTRFVPSHWPRSMIGWVGTGTYGSSGWMPSTPRSREDNGNEGVRDDRY